MTEFIALEQIRKILMHATCLLRIHWWIRGLSEVIIRVIVIVSVCSKCLRLYWWIKQRCWPPHIHANGDFSIHDDQSSNAINWSWSRSLINKFHHLDRSCDDQTKWPTFSQTQFEICNFFIKFHQIGGLGLSKQDYALYKYSLLLLLAKGMKNCTRNNFYNESELILKMNPVNGTWYCRHVSISRGPPQSASLHEYEGTARLIHFDHENPRKFMIINQIKRWSSEGGHFTMMTNDHNSLRPFWWLFVIDHDLIGHIL